MGSDIPSHGIGEPSLDQPDDSYILEPLTTEEWHQIRARLDQADEGYVSEFVAHAADDIARLLDEVVRLKLVCGEIPNPWNQP